MSMLTVLLYGFYLLVFSFFVAVAIVIIGVAINTVKNQKPNDTKYKIKGR